MLLNKETVVQEVVDERDKRRQERISAIANITINGFDGEALLKDISLTGFSMASKTFVDITPKNRYVIRIIPKDLTGLDRFELEVEVEVRWVRSTVTLFTAGFAIIKQIPATGNLLQKYIDHLKPVHKG